MTYLALHLFSVFGLTYLLRYTDGLMHIFRRFRELMGIKYVAYVDNPDEEFEVISDKQTAQLAGCFWCLSTWVSGTLAFLTTYLSGLPWPAYFLFAMAGIGFSGLIYEFVINRETP